MLPSRLMTSAVAKQGAIDHAFGAEHNRDGCLCGLCRNGGPGAFEKCRVRRRHRFPESPVPRGETLRKTNDAGVLDGRLGDCLHGQGDRLLGSRREPEVGECDSERVHILNSNLIPERGVWCPVSRSSGRDPPGRLAGICVHSARQNQVPPNTATGYKSFAPRPVLPALILSTTPPIGCDHFQQSVI